jgi:phosphatidylinositol dimannoside acyltransferase
VKLNNLARRFAVSGVFWRQFIHWAVVNTPSFCTPLIMATWTTLFFVFGVKGRKALFANLRVIHPDASLMRLAGMAFMVLWNFATTFADTTNFTMTREPVDWHFDGYENFEALSRSEGGAIILTAHMGNYDLGSYLFARDIPKPIMVVRAPETDPESDEHARAHRAQFGEETGRLAFGNPSAELALSLVHALQEGQVVAIQGDRVIGSVATTPAKLFGREVQLPSGPFALALATRSPIYPLFVMRYGWRTYEVKTFPAIELRRTSRGRDVDIREAVDKWASLLEETIGTRSSQWFTFFRFFDA